MGGGGGEEIDFVCLWPQGRERSSDGLEQEHARGGEEGGNGVVVVVMLEVVVVEEEEEEGSCCCCRIDASGCGKGLQNKLDSPRCCCCCSCCC